jgi:hypothetical protein
MITPKGSVLTEGEILQISVLNLHSRLARCVDLWGVLTNVSPTRSTVSADGPGRPVRFAAQRQLATLLEFLVPLTNYFVRRWFCAVHGPKHPLHRHNWLSFGKFKDTGRFLIPCPRHLSSRLPHSGEICKYPTATNTLKKLESVFSYLYVPFCCVWLCYCLAEFGSPEGLMNYPVLCTRNSQFLC